MIPKSIWATSERPAPTRPKKPRISPDRTSKLTSSDEAGTGESPHTDDRHPNLRIFFREKGPGFSTDHVTNDLFRRKSRRWET